MEFPLASHSQTELTRVRFGPEDVSVLDARISAVMPALVTNQEVAVLA